MDRSEQMGGGLPASASVLAVCAHPDDESFGLGAVLSAFADDGVRTSVLCLTHGEASTLGADAGDLHRIRGEELGVAADTLGVGAVRLLEFTDGRIAEEPLASLSAVVQDAMEEVGADLVLVFDEGGITGHPDHVRATDAARVCREVRAGARAGVDAAHRGGRPAPGRVRRLVRRSVRRGDTPVDRGGPVPPAPRHPLSCQPVGRQPGAVAAPGAPGRPRGPPVARATRRLAPGVTGRQVRLARKYPRGYRC